MDHHCGWISNCVGYRNQKSFLLYVFYYIACIILFLAISIQMLLKFIYVWLIILHILILPILLMVLRVLINQLCLFPFNLTTIESLSTQKSPFSFGCCSNLKEIFGTKWYLWPIPTYINDPKKGFHFKINPKNLP
ncbi:unnamed protein product [Moneuplotes crassus]|uniref:Palmitoyltransferase n=1 Tax=Euplotes crassus TaxID=5936 RepID=A0AAD1XQ81_EUPCR|nr:unnamed protein product [Moneuplotes crassus]